MDNRRLVFSSGVGGLTVVRELMRQLPHEEIAIVEIRHGRPMVVTLWVKFVNILGSWSTFCPTKDVQKRYRLA